MLGRKRVATLEAQALTTMLVMLSACQMVESLMSGWEVRVEGE